MLEGVCLQNGTACFPGTQLEVALQTMLSPDTSLHRNSADTTRGTLPKLKDDFLSVNPQRMASSLLHSALLSAISACYVFVRYNSTCPVQTSIHHHSKREMCSHYSKVEKYPRIKKSCSCAHFMSRDNLTFWRRSLCQTYHSKLWKARVSIPVPLAC